MPGVHSPVQCSIFIEPAPADPVGDVPTGLQDKVPFAVEEDEDVSVYRGTFRKNVQFPLVFGECREVSGEIQRKSTKNEKRTHFHT